MSSRVSVTASCPLASQSSRFSCSCWAHQRRSRPRAPASSITWPTATRSCCAGGETIRLVQIDTPEVYGDTECYGRQASALTESILPAGTRVRIATDPGLDQRDRDGRTLAYVWKGSSLVNLRLVREGAAAPYFYSGDKGRYATPIFDAAVAARKAGRGLWGHCRKGSVPLRATRGVSTGTVNATRRTVAGGASASCNPNYTPCVPEFGERSQLPRRGPSRQGRRLRSVQPRQRRRRQRLRELLAARLPDDAVVDEQIAGR